MAELFKVDSTKIVGGPGRLVTAAYGTKLPESIEDLIDPTTYVLKAGWEDVGATQEGIKVTRSYDEEETEVDQIQGPAETTITKWSHDVSTLLAENSIENRKLALIGGAIIQSSPKFGTPVKTKGALGIGATIITLEVAVGADFKVGGFLKIGNETKKIVATSGSSITVETGISAAAEEGADVTPIIALGTKRIGYGTVSDAPMRSAALISKHEKTGALTIVVLRKVKVSGESKEQTWGKEKRTIPLSLKAFAESNVATEENVYYEIEQVI
ncbi:phage tail tube protein [Bacillus cereus group sp. Bce041]|uniref:phage tail tube protein n=1 Tax=Bacillus cereus group sp. Bce041 TaxID=3445228 RepID=UPI0040421740